VTVVTIVIKEIEVLELTLGRILVVVDKAIQAIVVLIWAVLCCFAFRVLGAMIFATLPRPMATSTIKTNTRDVLEIWTTPITITMRHGNACALVQEELIHR